MAGIKANTINNPYANRKENKGRRVFDFLLLHIHLIFCILLTNIRFTKNTILRHQTQKAYAKYCHQIRGAKLARYKCLYWNLHMVWQQKGAEFTDVREIRPAKRSRLWPGVTWKADFSCHPMKLQIWFMVSKTCSFLLQMLQRHNTTHNHSWQVLISIKINT